MSERDIAAVMVTVDRSPGANYLAETLTNLHRSDLARSIDQGRLLRLELVSPDLGFAADAIDDCYTGGASEGKCPANLNVASALRLGADTGAPWVLFLEDDIDVCADFFDSVGAWLDDHARDDRRVYAFGANYGWIEEATAAGCTAANYPIGKFYGTQAFALRSEDALSLSAYLVAHCYDRTDDGTAYDLLMADWARQTWPEIGHFLASCPSFVDHIGRTSSIRPRPETHTFPSWPGREWSYLERRAA